MFVQAACAHAPATVSPAGCPNAFTVRVSPTMNTTLRVASDSAPLGSIYIYGECWEC